MLFSVWEWQCHVKTFVLLVLEAFAMNRGYLVSKLIKQPSELQLVDFSLSAPTGQHIRVRIEAAGVNFYDLLMCQGKYQTKPPLPFTPGTEFAGTVEAVGEGVPAQGVRIGDRVCGFVSWGAFAQTLTVPASSVWRMPASMSFDEAAGFLMTNATSYIALHDRSEGVRVPVSPQSTILCVWMCKCMHVVLQPFDFHVDCVCLFICVSSRAKIRAGQIVLVHAAAGGVGVAAVQIAKAMGCAWKVGELLSVVGGGKYR